ncbi:MAG: DinB family protein [Flavobacteriales bacterium]|nr:DinB family protein [Flavobacteriales bacterium]
MRAFEILRETRKNIVKVVEGLSIEQLNEIPTGYNNNMMWNLGHILCTQQALNYRLTNQPMNIEIGYIEKFKKGTQAAVYVQSDFDYFLNHLFELVDILETDYSEGKFKEFMPYETSYGIKLNNIEEAIEFAAIHEALHLGYIMAQKRAILGE